MKTNPFLRFLTNNRRFKPNDPDYGKTYLVNIFLLVLFVVCAVNLILNLFVEINIIVLIINLVGFLLALSGIIYFHKTDNVDKINFFSVAVLLMLLFFYIMAADPGHHSLYWLVIFPPVVFFLLGYKKAIIISFFYFVILIIGISINYNAWEAKGFGSQSFVNIINPTIILIFLISFYERSRSEISQELELRNQDLADNLVELSNNKEKFEILLASTEEGIFGMNLDGECIFCNKSGLKFLGYDFESELLGENMHNQIHSKDKSGNLVDIDDCKISNVYKYGLGVRVSDEVFWKKNGTCFDVEYAAYPQYKGNSIIGIVITFRDITQERVALERMRYINSHDWLTGLNNRNFFEKAINEIDKPENLPISIIFSDINRLKLTNDIFGHSAGDKLLTKGAEILRTYKKEHDILARVGGDEFVLVLPRTHLDEAIKIEKEIQNHFSAYSVNALPCSMAVGVATKVEESEEISQIITNAENEMYKEKTINRHSIHEDMIYSLIRLLHTKSPRERTHSENVMKYAAMIGTAVNLPATEMAQLKKMAYFHDIGKLVLEDELLRNEGIYSKDELARIKQHPAVAYRILNLFDETLDIATGVYGHHENWDGTGYPKGLKGEEIPYMARIISVAEVYDALTNNICGSSLSEEEALKEIRTISGIKLQPELVSAFCSFIEEDLNEKI